MGIFRKIKHSCWSFIEGVENLIYWLPIIWKDRQFDYECLLNIINHKLKYMEKFFNSDDAWSADAKEIALELQEFRKLLEYIESHQFEEDAMKPYYDKYPILYTDFIRHLNRERTEEEMALFRQCCDDIEVKYNIAMDEFCKIFKNRLLNWWD